MSANSHPPSRAIRRVLATWLAVALCACSDAPAGDPAAAADGGVPGGVHFTSDLGATDASGTSAVDVLDDGGVGGPDVVITAGGFGAPCLLNGDCDSGFCVQGPAQKVCSKLCVDSCEAGWTCAQVSQGSSDTSYVCLPEAAFWCSPCTGAAQCNHAGSAGNLCVPFGDTGSFCGVACNPAAAKPCPGGGTCQVTTEPSDGTPVHQCMPADGKCTCSSLARQKGASTACSHKNFNGVCTGQRSCGLQGLSACNAAVPAEEVCDGTDNNCDGQTDEMNVVAQECANNNTFGSCQGQAKGCVDGKVECDAPTPAAESCNGVDDDCDGQTDEGLCDDGDPCTKGTCNPDGSCKQSPAPGAPCDDGSACTASDLCVSGQCVGGKPVTCDDGNVCTTDACDPLTGCTTSPSSGPCADDGDPCTGDVCSAGVCAHPPGNDGQACADDGKPCTMDVCTAGKCTHPAAKAGTPCADDGKPCTQDICDGAFACTHPPKTEVCTIDGNCVAAGQTKPGAVCMGCNPKLSTSQWVQLSGAPCDDGDPCTSKDTCVGQSCAGQALDCSGLSTPCAAGICNQGKCISQPKAAGSGCNDGDACTVSDVCTGGKCVGKTKNCSQLDSACSKGVCSGGSCVKTTVNSGGGCSDGDPCTSGDICVSGKCKGKSKNCSALNGACKVGVCQGGACVPKNKANGTSCSDGDVCTSKDKCSNGKCAGTANKDSYEPNNFAPGKQLADKADCDNPSTLFASISPKGETDWYHFEAKDKAFCTIKPSVKISAMAGNYDVCIYFKCGNGKSGSKTVKCDAGQSTGGGPSGSYGCCSNLPGTQTEFVKISPTCTTLGAGSESGKVWIRVRPHLSSEKCGGYLLQWSAKH